MSRRPASHAGSWYSGLKSTLDQQTEQWLNVSVPKQARFVIGPHAGLKFCGHILGQTYASLTPQVERIFVLSPSHVKYFKGFRTSQFSEYETPLGNVKVDVDIVNEFTSAGISFMDTENDIKEHGVEMHTPFIKQVAPNAKIVPLVFCDVGTKHQTLAIELLSRYFNDPHTAFAVSTDFCHWGSPFDYQMYRSSKNSALQHITTSSTLERPIWQSIEELDRQGMAAASTGDAKVWKDYIDDTGNTVCGQKPLEVLMSVANANDKKLEFEWIGYAQSGQVTSADDMSVSYASAVAD